MGKKSKYDRILSIYTALINGKTLKKTEVAAEFGVAERTIQRDLDDIRAFFYDNTLGVGQGKSLVYDRRQACYRLEDENACSLTNSEILAVCKILLESRTLIRDEMIPIIDKLMSNCIPEKNKRTVARLINNEKFHYVEPHHGKKFVDRLWELGEAIRKQQYVEITYERQNKEKRTRRLKPVGIMVSEYYFYLTAFIDDIDRVEHFDNPDDLFPTIYRIDRILDMKVSNDKFYVPYADKFEEGEFRKRVQFMYGGKLQTTKFKFKGPSIEAVLDRLPTAKILEEKDGTYTVEAETFGSGIDMWLRSQGEWVLAIN